MASEHGLDDVIDTLRSRLAETLSALMPDRPIDDLTDRIEPIIQGALERLELVPRAAFDAQVAALERLKERLATLEQRIADLERRHPECPDPDPSG